jgi:hypothetical protein
MTVLTSDMLDRIETIRAANVTAIKASTLADDVAIDLRQAINTAIDTTVSAILKANGNTVANSTLTPPQLQF